MLRLILTALVTAFFTLAAHAAETPGMYGGSEVPTFDEFPGICDTSKLAPAKVMPGDELWDYRTRIREGAAGSCANYNGPFTLIVWGCGTECQLGAIVDRTDGKPYPIPLAALGYDFRADSSLLIVNPQPDEYYTTGEIPDWLYREFYEFKNGEFVFLYRDKGEKHIDILDTPHPIRPEVLDEMEKDGSFKSKP